jgi:fluoride ion exporter CrcB/FEX
MKGRLVRRFANLSPVTGLVAKCPIGTVDANFFVAKCLILITLFFASKTGILLKTAWIRGWHGTRTGLSTMLSTFCVDIHKTAMKSGSYGAGAGSMRSSIGPLLPDDFAIGKKSAAARAPASACWPAPRGRA